MATASLYGNNDYTPLQYRPYELPVNDIMRAFVAKNQFWEQGAARVKSVYENALNLDLTLDQNKKYKEEFMTKAQEEMKKLSSMDLSDVDVQKQGMSIFSPLLKDKMVAIDDQLTKRRKSIFQEAESYKTKKLSKDGVEGEGYNQENLAYALDGFEEFNSMTNRDEKTLTNLYNKLGNKSYTPSYDITQEYDRILDKCKGTGTEGSNPVKGTLYMNQFSKTGADSNETTLCFERGWSDKARQQLSIKGWALYKNNPQQLYKDYENNQLGFLRQTVSGLKGSMDALKDSKKPEDIKTYEQYKLQYEEQSKSLKNAENEFNEMVGPNGIEYVMKNINTLAGGLYQKKFNQDLGKAFDSDKIVNKFTPDTAAIADRQMQNQRFMQNQDFQNDIFKIGLKYKNDLDLAIKKGEILPDINVGMKNPNVNATDITKKEIQTKNAQEFLDKNSELRNDLDTKYKVIVDFFKERNPKINASLINDDYILNYVDKYDKGLKNNNTFNEMLEDYKRANKKWWTHSNIIKAADIQAKQGFEKDFKIINDTKVKLSDGTVLNGSDILNIKKENYTSIGEGGVTENTAYYYKGKQLSLADKLTLDREFFYKNNQLLDKVREKRIEILGNEKYDAGTVMNPRLVITDNTPVSKMANERIKTTLGITGEGVNKTGYQLYGHGRDGSSAIVSINEDGVVLTTEKEIDKYLQTAKNSEANAKKVKIGGNWYIEIPKILPPKEGIVSDAGVDEAKGLKYFQVVSENGLKRKMKSYATSQELDYPYYPIQTPDGRDFRIMTVYKGGKTFLKPEKLLNDKKSWDGDSYPLYENAEDLMRDIEQNF